MKKFRIQTSLKTLTNVVIGAAIGFFLMGTSIPSFALATDKSVNKKLEQKLRMMADIQDYVDHLNYYYPELRLSISPGSNPLMVEADLNYLEYWLGNKIGKESPPAFLRTLACVKDICDGGR